MPCVQVSLVPPHRHLIEVLNPQMDRDVEIIHVEDPNTVRTLRDQLARLAAAGYTDTVFPILRSDERGGSRMLGFIGGNELEHALSTPSSAARFHESPEI